MLVPVLLCGGIGKRLWPLSRKSYPKQFLKLIDKNFSLLQMTAKRIENAKFERSGWIVVCNEENRFLVEDQLLEINIDIHCIILEPIAKNTAPAITLAAYEALKISPEAKLLVQPADHFIPNTIYFSKLIEASLLVKEPIITFGVKPTSPETNYGYIKVGQKIDQCEAFKVEQFVEKPDLENAIRYVDSGKYLWNSGIFILDVCAYLEELELFNPLIKKTCKEVMQNAFKDMQYFLRIDSVKFKSCPSISVDYGVIEKSNKVSVIPYVSEWSDLGFYESLTNNKKVNSNRNTIYGDGLTKNTSDTLIHSEERLVVALGVRDLVIVDTYDVVFVATKKASKNVNKLVDDLRNLNRIEADEHLKSYRPWGNFRKVHLGDGFQIKIITVKPGKSLSLQSHKYRSEHWVVTSGEAEVINGDKKFKLSINESTYIAAGNKHRLINPGLIDLILIEVQVGSYLGEDDIERFSDLYGRK